MSKLLSSIVREDEEVRQIIRANPVKYWLSIIFSLIFIIGPFFFLYPLMQFRFWGLAAFSGALLLGIVLSIRTWFLWYRNMLIITDQRLVDVDQKKIFHRVVSEVYYSNIQDVSFAIKGILPTLFRFGTLVVQTAANNETIEIDGIRRPEKLQAVIVKLQGEFVKKQSFGKMPQSEQIFMEGRKVLEDLEKIWGKKKLKEIVSEITKES